MFVTFEGLDGSGGTTQLGLLAARIGHERPGREIVRTREPSNGPVGAFIRAELGEGSALRDDVFPYLFAADRRDHLDRVVEPALSRGAVVLSDRYLHSSLAYQSLAVGLQRVDSLNAGFRIPDLVILLMLSPEECMARMEDRPQRDRFETVSRLRQIETAYSEVLARKPGHPIVRIDALGTREAVHERVWSAFERAWRG